MIRFYRVAVFFLSFFFLPFLGRAEISGPPITDNNYNLDLRQGPVLGSARQVALGGAYIGVAEGIGSLRSNSAGVAFRTVRSTGVFDWDWTAGLTDLKSNDFDNNGVSPPEYVSRKILSLGLMGQYGPWGAGFSDLGEVIDLKNSPTGDSLVIHAVSWVGGRQFKDQEITVGAGLRSTYAKVRTKPVESNIGKLSGVGWQTGLLWNPKKGPYRFGLSYASELKSDQSLSGTSTIPVTVQGLIIPQQIIMPAEWGVGGSYRVRSAPFWKGHPWLVTSDVTLMKGSENSVGIESVLAQTEQPITTEDKISFRFGTELETWPNRLRLRLGTYYEPSYYQGVSGRTHLTGGLEARLFRLKFFSDYVWGLSYAVDSATGYLNQLISIGFWYSS